MAEGFKIEIVSPERLLLSETVQSVTVPGTEGYFTVMANHAPFMSTLKPGFLTVTGTGGAVQTYYVRGGFADVSPDGLTVLAEQASTFADFDRAEIEGLLAEAQTQLQTAQDPDERSYAQDLVNGWMNLMMEATHLDGAHVH